MKSLKPFDWFLICGVSLLSLACLLVKRTEEINSADILGAVAGITGVCCVVLVAKRNIVNYLFGVINVSLYAYISYKSQIYGDAFLNALYYFPMQFIGWWQWSRNKENPQGGGIVKARRMSRRGEVLLIVGSCIAVAVTGFMLQRFTSDPQPYKDAATTVLSIIAQFLMVRMFMEQWILWITTNVLSIIMWSFLFYNGEEGAALMVVMWFFYLANSINGLIVWNRASKGGLVTKSL